MVPLSKPHRLHVRLTILALAKVLLSMVCSGGQCFAQVQQMSVLSGVSSETFLRGLPPGSLPTEPAVPSFPTATTQSVRNDLDREATQAAYSTESAGQQSEAVTTAQFATPKSALPIGSGVAIPSQTLVLTPPPTPQIQSDAKTICWRDRLGLDPTLPNFLVGYEAIGFRRSNDSVGPYSQGEGLPRFDQDISGRYTFSRLLGNIDRIEFKFTGPFYWDRQSTAMGLVDSNLPPSIATSFDGADRHQQSHRVRLSSYELNRCWSGDDISKIFCGLRLIDYDERYQLESTKGVSSSTFRLETNNFLVGGQMGMSLFRPISQRLTAGFESAIGLYGNFASASLNAVNASTTLLDTSDNGLRVNSMFQLRGIINYRVSQNIVATGGYEGWYFPGLATVADQRLSNNAQLSQFSMRTEDDQLFRGWSAGLSARF